MVENSTITIQIPVDAPNANGKEVLEKALKKFNKTKSRVQVKCPKCETVFLPSVEEIQSRAGASSRRKGHGFERLVAKKLQKWWNQNGKFKYEFKRTPQSGGSCLKQGWGLAGDIATTDPKWPFHVECKNAPGSFKGLHQFFSAEKFVVWEWLEQCKKDCPVGKRILLVVNRFDQPTWCIAPAQDYGPTGDAGFKPLNILRKLHINSMAIEHCSRDITLYVWSLDDMLSKSPEVWL
jgi:hypothetical protein